MISSADLERLHNEFAAALFEEHDDDFDTGISVVERGLVRLSASHHTFQGIDSSAVAPPEQAVQFALRVVRERLQAIGAPPEPIATEPRPPPVALATNRIQEG